MHKETGVTEQNRVDDLLPYSPLDQRGRFNKQQTSDPNQDYAYMGNRMRASSNRCDSSAAREPGHTTRLGMQPHTPDVRVTATLLSLYERTHHTVMALSPSASARISQYARAHHSGNRQQRNSTTAPIGNVPNLVPMVYLARSKVDPGMESAFYNVDWLSKIHIHD